MRTALALAVVALVKLRQLDVHKQKSMHCSSKYSGLKCNWVFYLHAS